MSGSAGVSAMSRAIVLTPELKERLGRYVTQLTPFGPPDADAIPNDHADCSVILYDWENSGFANLLKGSHVLIGRRGSGKSSLLNTYRIKGKINQDLDGELAKFFRDRHSISRRDLSMRPDFVVDINLEREIYNMKQSFSDAPPVGIAAERWLSVIWYKIACTIRDNNKAIWNQLSSALHEYVDGESNIAQQSYMTQK